MDGNEFGKYIVAGYDSDTTKVNKGISVIRSGGIRDFSDLKECVLFIKEYIHKSEMDGVNITRNGYEGILIYKEIAQFVEGKCSEDGLQVLEKKFRLVANV